MDAAVKQLIHRVVMIRHHAQVALRRLGQHGVSPDPVRIVEQILFPCMLRRGQERRFAPFLCLERLRERVQPRVALRI